MMTYEFGIVLNSKGEPSTGHSNFQRKIKIAQSGCWEWQGSTCRGYGAVIVNGKWWLTHRYSYQYFIGNVENKYVLHKCDNPKCCNPDHLYLGSLTDNMVDRLVRGRDPNAKLNESKVSTIKQMRKNRIPIKEIAKQFRIGKTCIKDVTSGKSWKHVK